MTGVLFITAAVSIVFAVWLVRLNISPFLVIILTILALLPIQDAAEIIICKGISIFFKPHHLPKMEFTEGIPDEFRTLIVYATLLSNKAAAARTFKHMVNAHLNNKDKNLPVAILTHFKDSSQEEVTEEESELLNFVSLAIKSLNKKHGQDTFYLFHRDRKWNIVSRKWVGWERKRGGVEELNKWLLGKLEGEEYREYGPGKTFSHIAGKVEALGKISKIILLDSDNELPAGSAFRLVAMAAHPLNQPVVNETDKIVVQGYGVLQPFPVPSRESCARSLYARMEGWHRRPNGPHHYILQILQNIFREGTFIGKGIYDVQTHVKVLAGRFPDNQLLSHDKVESGFLRAAFVADVIIMEEALDNFLAGMNQIERWLKGDKQALHWALSKIPNKKWERVRNPLSSFNRWNLIWPIKKQLSVPSLILLCLVGWFEPELPAKWSSLILASMIAFPYLLVPISFRSPVVSLVGIVHGLFSIIVYLAFSLHRAFSIVAAMVRITFQFPERSYVHESLRRMKEAPNLGIIRKFLRTLQILAGSVLRRPRIDWVTASEVKRKRKIYSISGIYAVMFPSLVICLCLGVGCFMFVEEFIFVLPVLVLWFIAPWIVYVTSR
ncbi:MAG: hypothetical protein E3J56_15640 [Candidatus Aminicenantes bacterium]|nr:MAG: hypothetical protein E3J56_15640 [Candidatus Aminicenantes bacterium]